MTSRVGNDMEAAQSLRDVFYLFLVSYTRLLPVIPVEM